MFVTAAALLIVPGLTAAEKNQDAKEFHLENGQHARVCAKDFSDAVASCDAHVLTDANGKAKNFASPSGYGPAQFRAAYGINTPASKKIIAIVDAYNDPNIKSDLDIYDNQYFLGLFPTCTGSVTSSSSACFQKVDQRGGTRYPATNAGWALEISLDVEIAHGACPSCSILLVEADSSSFGNLLTAENRAGIMGADVISNSWGGNEFSGETSYDSNFSGKTMPITFSSGDSGFGVEYPAASRYVTSVGGTSLSMAGLSYVAERAWSGAGSGCSLYESKQFWQTDAGCANRTVADVSADADPGTGAAVYDSVRFSGQSGWFQVGGTSLAAPLVAAVYAVGASLPSGITGNHMPYTNTSALHDVISGSNGSCGGSYLCTSKPGYDGPTGLGTPNGSSAF